MPKTPNTCQGITDFNSELIMDFVKDRNRNPQELIAISKGLTNTIKVNADRLKY